VVVEEQPKRRGRPKKTAEAVAQDEPAKEQEEQEEVQPVRRSTRSRSRSTSVAKEVTAASTRPKRAASKLKEIPEDRPVRASRSSSRSKDVVETAKPSTRTRRGASRLKDIQETEEEEERKVVEDQTEVQTEEQEDKPVKKARSKRAAQPKV